MTLDQAIAMFEGLLPDALEKAEQILDVLVTLEAHEVDGDSPTEPEQPSA